MKAVFRIGRLCFIFINYSINAIQKAINSARLFDCIKLDWLRKKFATINVNWKTIWIKNKKDERKTMSKQVGDLSIENVKQVCHIFSSSLYISINRIYFRTVFKKKQLNRRIGDACASFLLFTTTSLHLNTLAFAQFLCIPILCLL